MKIKQKIAYFLTAAVCCLSLASVVHATIPTTLSLNNTTGDSVRVNVTGEANSSVQFSFLPPGASTVTSIVFGTTDASGNLATTISSGGYGIPSGSPVFVAINGNQSATLLWPAYTSTITLAQTNVQIAVGQSVTVGASSALILAANSMNTVVSASVSGSQVTITGTKSGSGTLTMCGANVGCNSIAVVVGGTGQTQITFNLNNIILNNKQSKNINIFGGSNNGYLIKSNSNPTSVDASISGTSDIVSLFGKNTPGTATINICSVESNTNCASLYVTTLSGSVSLISFSQNDITLIPGLSRNVTVSGGPDSNYYISSNSNSGIAVATIFGNTLTLTGGSNSGATVISVCSATVNATCGNLNITNNATPTTPSDTVLSFSQNVVSVASGDTSNVTVTGGDGSGYTISSNSNPSVVTAKVNGNTNVISLYGNTTGSAIVAVCSARVGTTCASLYVNVGPVVYTLTFGKNNVSLASGEKMLIPITGGSGTSTITSNSNPDSVAASLNNDGNVIVITGGNVTGASVITVCSVKYTDKCSTLYASVTVPASDTPTTPTTPNTPSTPSNPNAPTETQLEKILADAHVIFSGPGVTSKNLNLEAKINTTYTKGLVTGVTNISTNAKQKLNDFIAYGTFTTEKMGAGERAGVIGSYKNAFGKLPATENEWSDVMKIANGRWTSEVSSNAVKSAESEFKKIYGRIANLKDPHDSSAISIIAYGLRPAVRNSNSEKSAINIFKKVYGHYPAVSLAWDIVRAIAYSGAKR